MCLRNNPLYHAGAVAFSVSAGIPKVGVLLESVWNMNDSCRFQLRSPESLKSMEKTTKTQEIKSVSVTKKLSMIRRLALDSIMSVHDCCFDRKMSIGMNLCFSYTKD